jgi:heat shock protein 1/8
VSDNNLLGTFSLQNLPPMPKGKVEVEVTFELDTDGILHVSAVDKSSISGASSSSAEGSTNASHITISNDKSRLSADEIRSMLLVSDLFAESEAEEEASLVARRGLQIYVESVRKALTESEGDVLSVDEKENVSKALAVTESWLEEHDPSSTATSAETDDTTTSSSLSASSADISAQQHRLEELIQPSLRKLVQLEQIIGGMKISS